MTSRISVLELAWRVREGARLSRWARQTRREYLDFVVDGVSLRDAVCDVDAGTVAGDLIGCLGWGSNKAYEDGLVDQLMLEKPSELETGRRLLYVCPECGDVGCGAVTAIVEEEAGCFVWKEFGYEVNYRYDEDDALFDLAGYEGIGPFRFDKRQYRDTLINRPKSRS